MKLFEAKDYFTALTELTQKKLPVKISYAIAININNLNGVIKPAEEQRVKILTEYAEKDSEGNPVIENNQYKITDMEAVNREITELYTEDVAVDVRKVKQSCFDDLENDRYDPLTPGEFFNLQFMVEEDEGKC